MGLTKRLLISASIPLIVMAATRCYDNLGCYDSGIYHALPQDPAHVRTEFHLSCRGHLSDVIVEATSDEDTIRKQIDNSCFAADRPSRFLIHGFRDKGTATWINRIRESLLRKDECNVFAVNWEHGAKFPYVQAVANTFLVAKQIANFIRHLETVQGASPLDFHVIGHSLGGQIAGNTGNDVRPSRLGRITGLDPAAPYYEELNDTQRLDASDAIFVDVIHTDGEKFTGTKGYGSLRPQGHVDLYPNGGERQPGCVWSADPIPLDQLACSHVRAYELFAVSLDLTFCSLTAYACNSWDEFEAGSCHDCNSTQCVSLGMDVPTSGSASGAFYLSTSDRSPYCGKNYLMSIELSPLQTHSYGRFQFSLMNQDTGRSKFIDFSRRPTHYHSSEREHHVVTASFTGAFNVTGVVVRFEPGTGLSTLGTSNDVLLDHINVTDFEAQRSWMFRFKPGDDDILRGNQGEIYLLDGQEV